MNPITQGISDFFLNVINNILMGLQTAFGPFVAFISNTPPALTTDNPVVAGAWLLMVGVADAFLGLYVIIKLIQMMHGQATGTIHAPISQFIPRIILTVILIHTSAFLGSQLIALVNALCALFQPGVLAAIRAANGGQMFNGAQTLGLGTLLFLVFGFSFVRLVFQAIKRIVFFNVLFALSGPAFLMTLDPQTAPWFQFWSRTFVTNILQQFFQFLTLVVGFQFLLATKQTGFTGFIIAIGILNLAAEIPSILARFTTLPTTSGVGDLVRSAVLGAAFFR